MLTEPLLVTLKVTSTFEALNISYVIGGSLASAVHGTMRATMDADIVADLHPEHISPLVEALNTEFYADELMIKEAISTQSSFNLIHLETMLGLTQLKGFSHEFRKLHKLINFTPFRI